MSRTYEVIGDGLDPFTREARVYYGVDFVDIEDGRLTLGRKDIREGEDEECKGWWPTTIAVYDQEHWVKCTLVGEGREIG